MDPGDPVLIEKPVYAYAGTLHVILVIFSKGPEPQWCDSHVRGAALRDDRQVFSSILCPASADSEAGLVLQRSRPMPKGSTRCPFAKLSRTGLLPSPNLKSCIPFRCVFFSSEYRFTVLLYIIVWMQSDGSDHVPHATQGGVGTLKEAQFSRPRRWGLIAYIPPSHHHLRTHAILYDSIIRHKTIRITSCILAPARASRPISCSKHKPVIAASDAYCVSTALARYSLPVSASAS